MCDKIVSAYAQHAHAIIFENYSKSPIKMQISTIKNQNFEKPFRNPSNRTKVNFLKKTFLDISPNKFGFVYAVTAKMFKLRNSGENRRIRSEIFSENLPRAYKGLI